MLSTHPVGKAKHHRPRGFNDTATCSESWGLEGQVSPKASLPGLQRTSLRGATPDVSLASISSSCKDT